MEDYFSGFGLAFIAYNFFVGVLNTVAYNALKSSPIHLSLLESRLFHGGGFFSSITPLFTLLLRVNAVVFLVYLAFEYAWYFPIVLYLISLGALLLLSAILRPTIGLLLPALLGYVLGPILGVLIWLSM